MTKSQRERIDIAVLELVLARKAQAKFTLFCYMNGMTNIPVIAELKETEREFWRACHVLLKDR